MIAPDTRVEYSGPAWRMDRHPGTESWVVNYLTGRGHIAGTFSVVRELPAGDVEISNGETGYAHRRWMVMAHDRGQRMKQHRTTDRKDTDEPR